MMGNSKPFVRYVRTPHLLMYWDDDRLVTRSSADGRSREVVMTPLVVELLNHCASPQTVRTLAAECGVPTRRMRMALRLLARAGLVQRTNSLAPLQGDTYSQWNEWWPARVFHIATRDIRFQSAAEIRTHSQAKRSHAPRPPVTKNIAGPFTALAAPDVGGEFATVLTKRRTWRKFDSRPVPFKALSTLLNLTVGVQAWADTPEGPVVLKTSPSGGARHPTEAYVAALRCEDVARGLYHYSADRHGLTRIGDVRTQDVTRFLAGQDWFTAASAIVFFTGVVARTMWRYPYGRAYRALLIEAGHVCQTFCLAATWLGLAPFCTLALADSAIERRLGIDGIAEVVLYAAGIGTPLANSAWAPWPDDRERHFQPHTFL